MIAIQLLSTPQGPVTDEPERRFDDDTIVIGRAPNCHVVLPDGLRIVSRQHARLTAQRGEVLLTCLSASAPVRVNDSAVPHGAVWPVHRGDLIRIGGFELRLNASPAGNASTPPSPHGRVAAGAGTPPAAVPGQRPRARLDEWFDLGPAPLVAARVAPALPATDGVACAPPVDDRVADGHPGWAPTSQVDLDLRSGAYAASSSTAPVGERRVFESLQQVLADPPQVDLPIGDALVLDRPSDAPPASPMPLPASTAPTPGAQQAQVAQEARAAPAALDHDAHMALVQAFLEGAGLAQKMGATSTQVIAPITLSPAWMRHVGQLLRASVEGVLALLHSRSTVKREMRAEVTVIARRQNNPLKFAPDTLAALAHLLAAKRSPGFLEPVAAVKDAHEDLLVHHLAVVAGMRAAMFELIARLGPDDVVRDEGPAKGLAATMPSLHEAALWRRYRQRHTEMTARLDDDFEAVFGREFTKAYEAQARRVREQAGPEDTRS